MEVDSLAITGGAGFVGSTIALRVKQSRPSATVVVLDNLARRGSELNVPRLQAAGIVFQQGDVSRAADLEALPRFELMIHCAAEPAVHGEIGASPRAGLETNLVGTINCLELARARRAAFLYLSTSRVYPIARLNALPYREDATRFSWQAAQAPGFSEHGVAEDFPLEGARSLYGAAKLAGELIIQEYAGTYGLKALTNRCGVLAGPWQMSRIDQGVVGLWVAAHCFQRPLQYLGFGGQGKQVRDLLHVDDLIDLVQAQWQRPDLWDGRVYNVGGGPQNSVSLFELTALCQEVTGRTIPIHSRAETNPLDVRIFATDIRKVQRDFAWQPRHNPRRIVEDVTRWLVQNPAIEHALWPAK